MERLLHLLDLCVLRGLFAEGVEAHLHELRNATVVMMSVMLVQCRHRFIVCGIGGE
jgi:hypothetical protein